MERQFKPTDIEQNKQELKTLKKVKEFKEECKNLKDSINGIICMSIAQNAENELQDVFRDEEFFQQSNNQEESLDYLIYKEV